MLLRESDSEVLENVALSLLSAKYLQRDFRILTQLQWREIRMLEKVCFGFRILAIPRHSTPRINNGVHRRSHRVSRRSNRLLPVAVRDIEPASDGRDASPRLRECRAFLRIWNKKHCSALPPDMDLAYQKHAGARASRIPRPVGLRHARLPWPPSAHRKCAPPAICPIPAGKSKTAMAPRTSNHPRKQTARQIGRASC